ncbi:MAG: hypothetical protein ABR575_07925 [Actinomycetota bacterium]
MIVRRAALVAVLAVLAACRPDTVDLRYRFHDGDELSYRIEATASARWDVGVQGRGSYRVVFDVRETIEHVDDSGADVSVVMTPTHVEEHGLPSPGEQRRAFRLRVGPNGEVTEVLEVDGVPAAALDPDELALIGTYRPPLPVEPVRLHDRWQARQRLDLSRVSQEIETLGTLHSLRREDGTAVARLDFTGRGPLSWETKLAQGKARLVGSSSTTAAARFDIERGELRHATSTMSGDFAVTVTPEDGTAPVEGTLHLVLELALEKVEGAS